MTDIIRTTCAPRLSSRLANPAGGRLAALLMLAAAMSLGGCNWLGYGAHALSGGDKNKTVAVDADYRGLDGKSVAVLVAADEYTLFRHPGSPQRVARAVTQQLTADIPGIKPVDPGQVARFQRDNAYWNTLTYGELLNRLKVERIVYIDLAQYTTNEPGDKHVWRGVVVGRVGVAAADATQPNDLVYGADVSAEFPPGQTVGVLEANEQTIQLGMLKTFAVEVSRLFHDHEKVVPR